jgi:hypothetical protein
MRGPYPGESKGGLSALLKQEVSAVKRPNCSTSASVPRGCNAVAEDRTCEPVARGEALRHEQAGPCAQREPPELTLIVLACTSGNSSIVLSALSIDCAITKLSGKSVTFRNSGWLRKARRR